MNKNFVFIKLFILTFLLAVVIVSLLDTKCFANNIDDDSNVKKHFFNSGYAFMPNNTGLMWKNLAYRIEKHNEIADKEIDYIWNNNYNYLIVIDPKNENANAGAAINNSHINMLKENTYRISGYGTINTHYWMAEKEESTNKTNIYMEGNIQHSPFIVHIKKYLSDVNHKTFVQKRKEEKESTILIDEYVIKENQLYRNIDNQWVVFNQNQIGVGEKALYHTNIDSVYFWEHFANTANKEIIENKYILDDKDHKTIKISVGMDKAEFLENTNKKSTIASSKNYELINHGYQNSDNNNNTDTQNNINNYKIRSKEFEESQNEENLYIEAMHQLSINNKTQLPEFVEMDTILTFYNKNEEGGFIFSRKLALEISGFGQKAEFPDISDSIPYDALYSENSQQN